MCWNAATNTSLQFKIAYVDANCCSSCCTFLVFLEDFYAHIWCHVVKSRDVHPWRRDVRSRVFHPCDLLPRSQVSQCPHLLYGTTLCSSAMSVPAILMVSRCQVSRFQLLFLSYYPVHKWGSVLEGSYVRGVGHHFLESGLLTFIETIPNIGHTF